VEIKRGYWLELYSMIIGGSQFGTKDVLVAEEEG